VERAGFEGPGCTQGNGKERRGAGCLYLAQRAISGFSDRLLWDQVFPKNEKENLSMAERNALKKRADGIFETYKG
jgi:hypothetical protein